MSKTFLSFAAMIVVVGCLYFADAALSDICIGFPVKVNEPDPAVRILMRQYWDGMEAGIHWINSNGGVHNKTKNLCLVIGDPGFRDEDFPAALDLILQDPRVVITTGMLAAEPIMASLPILEREDAAMLNPASFNPAFYDYFHEGLPNLRPHPRTEWFGIVSHLVGNLHFRRIAVVRSSYPDDWRAKYTKVGEWGENIISEALQGLGLSLMETLVIPNGTTPESVAVKLIPLLMKKPQAIIFPGATDLSLAYFILAVRRNPLDTKNIYLVTGLIQNFLFEQVFPMYNVSHERVVTVIDHPSPSDTTNPNVRRFRNEITAVGYQRSIDSNLGFSGFIAVNFIANLIEENAVVSRKTIKDSIFRKSIFEVEGNMYGLFSKGCSADRLSLPLCECNQGLKGVTVVGFDENYKWKEIPNSKFQFSVTDCVPSTDALKRPALIIYPVEGNPNVSSALKEGGAFGAATLRPHVFDEPSNAEFVGADFNQTLHNIIANKMVTVIVEAPFDKIPPQPLPENVMHINPDISDRTIQIPYDRPDIVLLDASVEQQIHAIIHQISASGDTGSVSLIVRQSAGVGFVSSAFADSITTFSVASAGVRTFDNAASLAVALQSVSQFAIVVGITSNAEAAAIISAAKSASQPVIFLELNDVSNFYNQFAVETAIASRLRFATALPNWGALPATLTELENPLLYAYWGFLNSSLLSSSFATFRAFVEGRTVTTVLNRIIGHVTSSSFYSTWYSVSLISLDPSLSLGPYSSAKCSASTELCECNRGARSVHVRSFALVASGASTPLLTHHFSTCRVGYVLPTSSSLSVVVIVFVAIIGALVVGMSLFAALFFIRSGQTRDNSCAPKDAYQPFAVMFTDIQSSTTLWSRVPSSMGPGLDKHHAMIRELIKKYKCYEVKTIGDAFMVVSADPKALVKLAVELQQNFFTTSWGTEDFDNVYKDQERQNHDEGGPAPPTANDPLYSDHWNGIRVRVGIHYGTGDVVYDEVTKAYDYYGTVVNTASRVESSAHGGQVLVSYTVADELEGTPMKEQLQKVGAVSLRGVDEPVELHQLQTIPGRTFLPIRVEKEEPAAAADGTESQSMRSSVTSGGVVDNVLGRNQRIRQELQMVFGIYSAMYSVLSESDRDKTVSQLCKKWHIEVGSLKKTEKKMWLLAEKVTRVWVEQQKAALREMQMLPGELQASTSAPMTANNSPTQKEAPAPFPQPEPPLPGTAV